MTISSITLRSYRAFGPDGVTLSLKDEFVAVMGVNNSGKSTMLRAIYELRPLFAYLSGGVTQEFLLMSAGQGYPFAATTALPGERIFPAWSATAEPRITVKFDAEEGWDDQSISEVSFVLARDGLVRIEVTLNSSGPIVSPNVVSTVSVGSPPEPMLAFQMPSGESRFARWSAVQRDLSWLSKAMYIGPFRNAVNSGGGQYYDLQIGRDFISQFNNFKTGLDASANEAVQLMTDSLAAIFGFERLEVSAAPDGSHLLFMVDGKSFRGTELGAGIAQFVVVAANVLVRRPTLLLIDEPELNLHASLQVKFLSLLAQYSSGPTIFASHSLGLARSVANVTLVSSLDDQGFSRISDYQSTPDLALTLGELGYGGFQDSAFRAVLLVEGVTEVLVFHELLAKRGLRNEVVVVPLGGDSLATGGRDAELADLRRLSSKIFAVVDSERTASSAPADPRRGAFKAACDGLGIRCLVLDRRATENYLDPAIAAEVMGLSSVPSLGPYDPPPSGWSKAKNWRVARRMSSNGLDGTDLGTFLEDVANQVKPNV